MARMPAHGGSGGLDAVGSVAAGTGALDGVCDVAEEADCVGALGKKEETRDILWQGGCPALFARRCRERPREGVV